MLALIDLYEKKIDRNEHAIGVSLALCKAFDTIDYNILFDKINIMVYEAWLWTGLDATCPTGCNSFNLTVNESEE